MESETDFADNTGWENFCWTIEDAHNLSVNENIFNCKTCSMLYELNFSYIEDTTMEQKLNCNKIKSLQDR